jgi:hypothetical protein
MTDETVTVTWIDGEGRVCEADLPAGALERFARGEPSDDVVIYRWTPDEALPKLRERLAEIERRRAELVSRYPGLKSEGRRRP